MPAAMRDMSNTLNVTALKEIMVAMSNKKAAPINKLLLPNHFIKTRPAIPCYDRSRLKTP
jgi:hypothetical protein